MKITILTYGSRGDVQPYIALGLGLQQRGHQVVFAAPTGFDDFVRAYGLKFHSLPGNTSRLMQDLVRTGSAGKNLFTTALSVYRFLIPIAADLLEAAQNSCRCSDLIIHSLVVTGIGRYLACRLEIPDISAMVFPVFTPTSAFPNPFFPPISTSTWYNRQSHIQFENVFLLGNRLLLRRILGKHAGDLTCLDRLNQGHEHPQSPVIYGISPTILPPPPDWNDNIHITGYWFLKPETDWQPSIELQRFLETGDPPIFIGFGSMISHHADRLTQIALTALQQTRKRGIIMTGWGGLSAVNASSQVYPIQAVPLDWLFPQVSGAVHHGGVGTTTTSLRSGVPTMVVPFIGDQQFWGRQVWKLGAGPRPIPQSKLTARRLAEAIEIATSDPHIRQRAHELGSQIHLEDGIENAIRIIEEFSNTH